VESKPLRFTRKDNRVIDSLCEIDEYGNDANLNFMDGIHDSIWFKQFAMDKYGITDPQHHYRVLDKFRKFKKEQASLMKALIQYAFERQPPEVIKFIKDNVPELAYLVSPNKSIGQSTPTDSSSGSAVGTTEQPPKSHSERPARRVEQRRKVVTSSSLINSLLNQPKTDFEINQETIRSQIKSVDSGYTIAKVNPIFYRYTARQCKFKSLTDQTRSADTRLRMVLGRTLTNIKFDQVTEPYYQVDDLVQTPGGKLVTITSKKTSWIVCSDRMKYSASNPHLNKVVKK